MSSALPFYHLTETLPETVGEDYIYLLIAAFGAAAK